jgi:hypothetical protein
VRGRDSHPRGAGDSRGPADQGAEADGHQEHGDEERVELQAAEPGILGKDRRWP